MPEFGVKTAGWWFQASGTSELMYRGNVFNTDPWCYHRQYPWDVLSIYIYKEAL